MMKFQNQKIHNTFRQGKKEEETDQNKAGTSKNRANDLYCKIKNGGKESFEITMKNNN